MAPTERTTVPVNNGAHTLRLRLVIIASRNTEGFHQCALTDTYNSSYFDCRAPFFTSNYVLTVRGRRTQEEGTARRRGRQAREKRSKSESKAVSATETPRDDDYYRVNERAVIGCGKPGTRPASHRSFATLTSAPGTDRRVEYYKSTCVCVHLRVHVSRGNCRKIRRFSDTSGRSGTRVSRRLLRHPKSLIT